MSHRILRLGHRGDGIADGPVYVPLSLPGEEVEGEVTEGKIAKPRILTPSSDRIKSACTHFPACGGCALHHASPAFLETWKADQVRIALQAHGIEAPVRQVHTSPDRSRRRAALSARRTKKGALVGFHGRASDTIVEVPECRVVTPAIAALFPGLRDMTVKGASRRGELSITVIDTPQGAEVSVTGGHELDGPLRADLGQFANAQGYARLSWDGETVATIQPPRVTFDSIAVTPPPGAFLQATAEGEAALRASVAEALGDATSVADLFAGCGTFALPLARGAQVHAVEGEASLIAALDAGWRQAQGLKTVSTEVRDLFRRPLLTGDLARFDGVVIDPPRAGAEAQMRELANSTVQHIASVSCNPVTFARDTAILIEGGFRLNWIDVVDQFRWSPHVELVASLERDPG